MNEPTGINHPGWKGMETKYVAKHQWIYYHWGKASKCVECGAHGRMIHWANISGKYLRDIKDYKQLCVPCHRKFDFKNKYGNKCKKGHEYDENNTYYRPDTKQRACRKCINDAAKRYKLRKLP